jgi:two-component system CheB/CheR fusion protein
MPGAGRATWIRYAIALAATALAIGLRFALDPWLRDAVPFITVFGAVIIAAWFGGVGPAIVAAASGYMAADLLFIEPRGAIGSFGPERMAEIVAYCISTGLITALGGARRAAGLRAEASELRFSQFMENSPAAVFIKDEAGRYVFMNAAAEKVIGTKEWRGKGDEELLPQAAARRVRDHDRQVLESDAPAAYELTIEGSGGPRHFHSSKFPLRDAAGRVFVGSVTIDVTEEAQTAEELRQQREQLRLVTDTMSAGMVRVSSDLKYVWVNRVFASWAGKTPAEIVGRPIVEVVGADGLRALQPYTDRLLGGDRVEYERLASFPLLGQRWIHSVAEPTFDETGLPNGWVAVVSDVHARREAEEALRAAQQQLQIVLNTIPAAVRNCSRDRRYIWVNAMFARWLDKRAEDIVGRPMVEVVGEALTRELAPYIERVLAGEQVRYERVAEFAGLGRRWVTTVLSPTFDAGGAVTGWVATSSDVHDRKLMEETLRDADRRKDEFLATLAHELRNPLAPIRNAVAILAKKGSLDPELNWSREVIDRQVDQMSRLIDDLLDIARIASGKLLIRKQRIPLERAIDMALETSRPHINAAGHSLSVLLPSERVTVEADAARLAQVFSNLLNNAARYTEGRGEIALSAELHSGEVAVSVQDNGIGFPPEVGARLFEPFSQLTSTNERSHGGLGIGLSLVQGIVALHGGTVEARSAGPGKGSEFIVRLPLPSLSQALEEEKSVQPKSAVPVTGVKVLVADDNRDAADSLQRILSLYGYEVQVAYDGTAAMKLGEAFRPKVAVLDIGMPGANGFEVARDIRDKRGREITLIALTGWGQEGDRRRAMEAGFDYHLTKPVDPGALNDLLVEVVSK